MNHFTDDQLGLPVFDLTVTFKGIGTNRTMATCHYDPLETTTYFNTVLVEDP
jgi:hypothetical protein